MSQYIPMNVVLDEKKGSPFFGCQYGQRSYAVEGFRAIFISEGAVFNGSVFNRIAEDVDIILVFENGFDALCHPDVDSHIGNHSGVSTRA
jgi:hypothetical protein